MRGKRFSFKIRSVNKIKRRTLTEVILQLLGAPVFSRRYEVPHEALYFVIAPIMDQAVS